jgi:hypothetical protein
MLTDMQFAVFVAIIGFVCTAVTFGGFVLALRNR